MAEILLLAKWDTVVSHGFAMRAIEHLKIHRNDRQLDKIVLTFIGPEQRNHRYNDQFEAGNFAVLPDVKQQHHSRNPGCHDTLKYL